MLILNNKNMNTLNKLIVLFFTVFIFIPKGYSQNNADPGIGILMSTASLTEGSTGILRVTVGNYGNETIVENSLRVTISVGTNAEIIEIASGSDTHWSQESLTAGSGNTIKLTNSGGDFGSFEGGDILLTVRGNVVSDPGLILGNIVYITANNPLLCGGCPSPSLNTSQGNASNSNDNSQTSLLIICDQGSATAIACYETATFNNTTCVWNVTGTQPAQPTIECYETATFNNGTCGWDLTGDPPVEEVDDVLSLCITEGSINLITNQTRGLENVIDNFVSGGSWTDNQNSGGLTGDSFDPENVSQEVVYEFTYIEPGDCGRTITLFVSVNDDCIVKPCSTEDNIEISKVVTANNDGVNDFFSISEIAECGFTADVSIFNRWGKRVYYSNNYQNNWGGYHDSSGPTMGSNDKLPRGTYYYVIKVIGSGYKPITGYIYMGTN
ncbi:MAG: gliding motility-associated-like protein [Polaribacter sp.]|jgi:gliding motility-associated-like protein